MSEQKAYVHKDSRMLLQDNLHASRDSEDPTAWLRETEIVTHDFPYLANLIADSFNEWFGGLNVLPFSRSWEWCVLNFEGKYINNSLDQQELWRQKWEQAAASSLISETISAVPLTVEGKDLSFLPYRYSLASTIKFLHFWAVLCLRNNMKWVDEILQKLCRCITAPVFIISLNIYL